jgi:hypothetical protein
MAMFIPSLYTKKELHSVEPKFYNKRGLFTRYAFMCGYVEEKRGLRLHMEHGVYHVRGFRRGKPERPCDGNRDIVPNTDLDKSIEGEYHITGSFIHVTEARKFLTNPFTHIPSRNGSCTLIRNTVGV